MEKSKHFNSRSRFVTYPDLLGIFSLGHYEFPDVTQAQMRQLYLSPQKLNCIARKRSKRNSNVSERLSRTIYDPEYIKEVLEKYDPHLNGMKPNPPVNPRVVKLSAKKVPLFRGYHSYPQSRESLSKDNSLYRLSLILGKGTSFENLFDLHEKAVFQCVPRLELNSEVVAVNKELIVRSAAMTKKHVTRERDFHLSPFITRQLQFKRYWEDSSSQQEFLSYTPVPRNTPRSMKRETDSLSEAQPQELLETPEISNAVSFPSSSETSSSSSSLNDSSKTTEKCGVNSQTKIESTMSRLQTNIYSLADYSPSSECISRPTFIQEKMDDKEKDPLESSKSISSEVSNNETSRGLSQERISQLQNMSNLAKKMRTRHASSSAMNSVISGPVSSRDSIKVFVGSSTTPDVSVVGSEEGAVPQPSTENALPPNERPPSNTDRPSAVQVDEYTGSLFRSRTLSALLARTADNRRVNKTQGSLPIMPRKPKKK